MEDKKTQVTEQLDQVVGGANTEPAPAAPNVSPFAELPRVDDYKYTPDIIGRT